MLKLVVAVNVAVTLCHACMKPVQGNRVVMECVISTITVPLSVPRGGGRGGGELHPVSL